MVLGRSAAVRLADLRFSSLEHLQSSCDVDRKQNWEQKISRLASTRLLINFRPLASAPPMPHPVHGLAPLPPTGQGRPTGFVKCRFFTSSRKFS